MALTPGHESDDLAKVHAHLGVETGLSPKLFLSADPPLQNERNDTERRLQHAQTISARASSCAGETTRLQLSGRRQVFPVRPVDSGAQRLRTPALGEGTCASLRTATATALRGQIVHGAAAEADGFGQLAAR